MKTHWHILVVDDEEVVRESLSAWLREDGYAVDTATSGREAVEKAAARDYAIYFVDLKMPGGLDGIETMMQIRRLHAAASIIIVTAYATVDTAITAMKEGAQEYIVKPCNPEEISLLAGRIVKVRNLERENAILRKKLLRRYSTADVISKNPRMHEILKLCHEVSSLRSTVLIQGESGTGKEDTGSYIIYQDGKPVTIDVGVEAYTAQTFGPNRYKLWTMQSAYHNLPTIGGVMQLNGGRFKATDHKFESNDRHAVFSFNIASAYPAEAGVKSWVRTLTLDRLHDKIMVEEASNTLPCSAALQLVSAAVGSQAFLRADNSA